MSSGRYEGSKHLVSRPNDLDSLQDTPQPSPVGKQDSMEEDAGKNKVEQPGFGEPWAVQRARVPAPVAYWG